MNLRMTPPVRTRRPRRFGTEISKFLKLFQPKFCDGCRLLELVQRHYNNSEKSNEEAYVIVDDIVF
jgi:hypothetical protein